MIKVYNTLTRQKEEFRSLEPGRVRMYVCGPTTYNFIHLGNARPLVVFDTVRRYLTFRGYEVEYIQNFTDVDDKIINRAREEGCDPADLAQKYIDEYFKDAGALGVLEGKHPRVSKHMGDIVRTIQILVEKGCAYERDGDIFFRVAAFPDYGKLSGRSLEEMMSGARVEVDERKENPYDFALWKSAKPGEPSWESPWGSGRPGWHIECSVMSMKYLGTTLDIHGGGADLIFPHHENEISQSEAVTGRPFVRYWLHNGFITVNKEKMSKSLGNFFIVRDILEKYRGPVIRFYLLSTHYRSPLDFDDTRLEEAGRALERIANCRTLLEEAAGAQDSPEGEAEAAFRREMEEIRSQFVLAMDDDFNTALAISHVFEMVRAVNSYLSAGIPRPAAALEEARTRLDEMAGVLGLDLLPEKQDGSLLDDVIQALAGFRAQARQEKDYAAADRVRNLLQGYGITVEDSSQGCRCRWQKEPELDALIEEVLQVRQELRSDKNYARADLLREVLEGAGIFLEDTRDGCRWKVKA